MTCVWKCSRIYKIKLCWEIIIPGVIGAKAATVSENIQVIAVLMQEGDIAAQLGSI